jgi:hypothetical protein
MNRFVLQNTFIKVYTCEFLTDIFIKNKKSKLFFVDCVAVLNDFIYQTGGSMPQEFHGDDTTLTYDETFFSLFIHNLSHKQNWRYDINN